MQIHELTYGQSVNEGVLGAAGAVLGGVANQVGQQFLQKQGMQTDQYAGQRVAQAQRPEAAMQANAPLMKQMAKQGQQAWALTQQELAKRNNPPVASAAYLTPQELKPHLEALITQLVGFDYTKPAGADAAREVLRGKQSAKTFIDSGIAKILQLTKENPDKTRVPLDTAWSELMTKGVGPMQTYAQQSSAAKTPAAAVATTQEHPSAAKLATALGDQAVKALSNELTGKSLTKTGNPAVDGILARAGAILR